MISSSRILPSTSVQSEYVASSLASIQQAINFASPSMATTVNVGPGTYQENLTITKPLTLSGVDGTNPVGADATAPTINGTQPSGNVITVLANGVEIDGLHLNGVVNGGASAASVSGIVASNVTGFTAVHNTMDGFVGPGIDTSGSTNVVLSANAPAPQTISFSYVPTSAIAGGTSAAPAASATSGLPVAVTVDPSAASVCSYSGTGNVSLLTAGTCTLDANQAGNASYSAAPQVQQSFTVPPASQTVSFTSTAPSQVVVGDTAYVPTASATSGLAAVISVDAASTAVCSISGGSVTYQSTGTCTLDANQAGSAVYAAATQVQQSISVVLPTVVPIYTTGSQTFGSASPASFIFSTSLPSGLTMFGIPNCTTVNNGIAISPLLNAGQYTLDTSSCSGINLSDGLHYTVSYVSLPNDYTVNQATQTVSFTTATPSSAYFGGPSYTPTATASSGLPTVLTVDAASASVCSINGDAVSFTSAGTCIVDANQAGNTNYAAAPQVQQSFTVSPASQTVSFTSTAPTNAVVGGAAYVPTATATSALPVTITVDALAASVCSIDSSGNVTYQAAGTCVLDANQVGDPNVLPAGQAQQSFVVNLQNQTVAFTSTAPTNEVVGGPAYVPAASATSNLAPVITVDAASVNICSINGGSVNFQHAGICVLDVNQAGNFEFSAATQAQQSITVSPATQTVSFTSTVPTNAVVGGAVYVPTAAASSGLTTAITVDASSASVCSINGGSVSFQAAGTCILDVNQAGNADYQAATQAQQSFVVNQAPVFVLNAPSLTASSGQTYGYLFVALGSPSPTYSLAVGAPVWLSINASTGALSGTPPSGVTSFTYSVIATNVAGSVTAGPFTVTVTSSALTDAQTLQSQVSGVGPGASLTTKVGTVVTDLSAVTPNNVTVESLLVAFVNQVNAQSGKTLTVAQATEFVAEAKQIEVLLGY